MGNDISLTQQVCLCPPKKRSPKNQQRVAELERRLQELNEERAEMYKTQSENAQRLLYMNEQRQLAEKKEKQNSEE